MITVAKCIESIINSRPFLAEALVDGIVNVSSLARKIKPQVEESLQKSVKTGAIVMALNRLIPYLEIRLQSGISNIMDSMGDIIVRSHLSDYTYKNSDTLIERHTQLLKDIGPNKEFFYTMVQGVFESNLVVSESLVNLVEKYFSNEQLITRSNNLSAVTLKLPSNNSHQPGFYYFILKKIAWSGINIWEIISTTNEFTLVVKDEDIDKTFSVLKKLNQPL